MDLAEDIKRRDKNIVNACHKISELAYSCKAEKCPITIVKVTTFARDIRLKTAIVAKIPNLNLRVDVTLASKQRPDPPQLKLRLINPNPQHQHPLRPLTVHPKQLPEQTANKSRRPPGQDHRAGQK